MATPGKEWTRLTGRAPAKDPTSLLPAGTAVEWEDDAGVLVNAFILRGFFDHEEWFYAVGPFPWLDPEPYITRSAMQGVNWKGIGDVVGIFPWRVVRVLE